MKWNLKKHGAMTVTDKIKMSEMTSKEIGELIEQGFVRTIVKIACLTQS